MSGVLHPVGPETPGIYWLRRIGVLAAVVLVIVVVIWAIPKPTKAEPADPPPSTTSQTSSTSTTPSQTPTSAAPSTPAPITDCTAAATKVTTTGPTRVSADKKSEFTVNLANVGDVTCNLTVNQDTFELRVISGSDKIWTTKNCDKWLPTIKTTKVKAGASITVKITWSGKRSAAGCKVSGGLKAGTYVAKALYGDADPGNLILTLR